MNEIKEVIWNENSLPNLVESILKHKEKKVIPKGFSEAEYEDLKRETRKFLSEKFQKDFSSNLVIVNGHQPEFQHPGILFKDLLIHKIARLTNGLPLHIVVDTDQFEMSYSYPEKLDSEYAHVKMLHLKDSEHKIYSQTNLDNKDKQELVSILKGQLDESKYFLNPEIIPEFQNTIQSKLELLNSDLKLYEVNEKIREDFYLSRGISICRINVSELVKLHSFKVLVEKIRENLDTFRTVYNQSLIAYRKEHKIKNHAQPIPNLTEGEMPFWILDPVTQTRNVMKVNDSSDTCCILPKAVTLTMFMRLFISDYFIHGKGGGRYEEVSEHIIKDFFEIEAAPYGVASATMHLTQTEYFSVPQVDEKELELKMRDTIFSPEKFLESNHPLVLKKKELQEKFKLPEIDKKELHKSISLLNEEMGKLIEPEKKKLDTLKEKLSFIQHTNQVFQTRTYPFYYYKMDELIEYVNNL